MRIIILLIQCLLVWSITAQDINLPTQNLSRPIIERFMVKTGIDAPMHSSIHGYFRSDVLNYAYQLDTTEIPLSIHDRRNFYYLFKSHNEYLIPQNETTLFGKKQVQYEEAFEQNGETYYRKIQSKKIDDDDIDIRYRENPKPVLKYFYKTPANFWELNKPSFFLRVNPIVDIWAGANLGDRGNTPFFNRRGLSLRGGIDGRVYFYADLLETQAQFLPYVNQFVSRFQAIPGQGFFKTFESSIVETPRAYDFLNGQGFIGFRATKHINVQFGYGRNFIGDGERSLFLSDFSNNYLHLKLNTRIWKFHYQNIFAELSPIGAQSEAGDELLPKKYLAAHYLSYKVSPKFRVGLYEAVVFSRNNTFELQYLNPIMFYRTIEQAIGSPDNVLIGLDFRWDILRQFSIYGQLMADEFRFDELIQERRGWWANKIGVQLGAKVYDAFGVNQLVLGAEYNIVRPYTYTHRDSSANYAHYNQPLAHPLGANFQEIVATVRYPFKKKWLFEMTLVGMDTGLDFDGQNFGGNILLSSDTRVDDFNNEVGQGRGAFTLLGDVNLSYSPYHNLFFDLRMLYRSRQFDNTLPDQNEAYIGVGVRMNITRERMWF